MPQYTVKWEIELYAESPQEAARLARDIQRDPESLATYFEVTDLEGKHYDVCTPDP